MAFARSSALNLNVRLRKGVMGIWRQSGKLKSGSLFEVRIQLSDFCFGPDADVRFPQRRRGGAHPGF